MAGSCTLDNSQRDQPLGLTTRGWKFSLPTYSVLKGPFDRAFKYLYRVAESLILSSTSA